MVAGFVDVVSFLVEVVAPVGVEVAVGVMARSLRTASAPVSPHRAPVMSMRSLTMCLHAPSMIPVAIGQPCFRAVG